MRNTEFTSASATSTAAVTERRPFPPVVYVPTTSGPDPALRQVVLHTLVDGRSALYSYSAIDRLHRFYRADSSWVLCDVAGLQRIYEETPYEVLLLDVDPDLPAEDGDGTEKDASEAGGADRG